jgi:hypothetical protein
MKIVLAVLAVFFCLFIGHGSCFAARDEVIIGKENVHLLESPIKMERLIAVPKGEKLMTLREEEIKQGIISILWYQVMYDGVTGWVPGTVLENPDDVNIEISPEQRRLGLLREEVQNSIGKYNIVEEMIHDETGYAFVVNMRSMKNADVDKTMVRDIVSNILNIFAKGGLNDFGSITVRVDITTKNKDGLVTEVVVSPEKYKKFRRDPYASDIMSDFVMDGSFYAPAP